MEKIKLGYSTVKHDFYIQGSKETAKHIDDAIELINCDDVDCADCPFDSLRGCALVLLSDALAKTYKII